MHGHRRMDMIRSENSCSTLHAERLLLSLLWNTMAEIAPEVSEAVEDIDRNDRRGKVARGYQLPT